MDDANPIYDVVFKYLPPFEPALTPAFFAFALQERHGHSDNPTITAAKARRAVVAGLRAEN